MRRASARTSSGAERVIAEVFARVLGIDPAEIGPDDEFSSLGGRSLDVVRLAEALARVGIVIAVAELLHSARVSDLAKLSSP
jgi:aryl carrier-like protein